MPFAQLRRHQVRGHVKHEQVVDGVVCAAEGPLPHWVGIARPHIVHKDATAGVALRDVQRRDAERNVREELSPLTKGGGRHLQGRFEAVSFGNLRMRCREILRVGYHTDGRADVEDLLVHARVWGGTFRCVVHEEQLR